MNELGRYDYRRTDPTHPRYIVVDDVGVMLETADLEEAEDLASCTVNGLGRIYVAVVVATRDKVEA